MAYYPMSRSRYPAPASYKFALIDSLRLGDWDVYRLLASKPGVGTNPVMPSMDEFPVEYKTAYARMGANPTALHVCAENGYTSGVHTIFDAMTRDPSKQRQEEVDRPTGDGATALWFASFIGHTATVRMLCGPGNATVDKARHHAYGSLDDSTPLYTAACQCRPDTVEVLLRYGANPHFRRKHCSGSKEDDTSPLEIAALFGDDRTVQMLLDAGADPDSCRSWSVGDIDNRTSLHLAMVQPSIMELLLTKSTNVDYRTTTWRPAEGPMSAMDMACWAGDPLCIRALLEAGSDVTAPPTVPPVPDDDDGPPRCSMALRFAVRQRLYQCAAVVLSTGAVDPFGFEPNSGRPLIDTVQQNPAMTLLMDSRPCPDLHNPPFME